MSDPSVIAHCDHAAAPAAPAIPYDTVTTPPEPIRSRLRSRSKEENVRQRRPEPATLCCHTVLPTLCCHTVLLHGAAPAGTDPLPTVRRSSCDTRTTAGH